MRSAESMQWHIQETMYGQGLSSLVFWLRHIYKAISAVFSSFLWLKFTAGVSRDAYSSQESWQDKLVGGIQGPAVPMRVWRRHSALLSLANEIKEVSFTVDPGLVEDCPVQDCRVQLREETGFNVVQICKRPVWACQMSEMDIIELDIMEVHNDEPELMMAQLGQFS